MMSAQLQALSLIVQFQLNCWIQQDISIHLIDLAYSENGLAYSKMGFVFRDAHEKLKKL